jgi:fumarylacetoacetase
MELTWNGVRPVTVAGDRLAFVEDGDEIVLRASAPGPDGDRIGFGEARGRILPACFDAG